MVAALLPLSSASAAAASPGGPADVPGYRTIKLSELGTYLKNAASPGTRASANQVLNVRFRNTWSGMCVDAKPNSQDVYLWQCHADSAYWPQQWWRWDVWGTDTALTSHLDGKVLDADTSTPGNGGNVIRYPWYGGSNQRWFSPAEYDWASRFNGKCMEQNPADTGQQWQRLQMWDCATAGPWSDWVLNVYWS
ncbi:RICIN domain-containing protein [Streptomyces sp. NPDC057877]|uniref:RICIN domain-containing protein n=1 Tax=Streptomyces sp. NPDC057877 TaxID=3346269 RepID=UPI0036CD290F